MSKEEALHPELQKFKQFVKEHPGLITSVRKGEQGWQYYFQKWSSLGEKDSFWKEFKSKETQNTEENKDSESNEDANKKTAWYKQMADWANNIDFDNLEEHVNQLDKAFGSLRSLIGQFKPDESTGTTNSPNQQQRPPMGPSTNQSRPQMNPNPYQHPYHQYQRWY